MKYQKVINLTFSEVTITVEIIGEINLTVAFQKQL